MDYINIGTGVTTLRTETLVEVIGCRHELIGSLLAFFYARLSILCSAPSTSSYEYSRQHIVFGIMMIRKLKFTVLKNDMIASAQQVLAAVITAGATGQLELLSTAIMDGWMAGLGAAQPPTTDALGQLLSDYSRLMWFVMVHILISTVILVHKDIAGTLATEAAEDPAQVAKLRSALESVDHKRRKILQQMKNDAEMLNLESGAAPIRSPSTSAEDARLVSLISLDSILKQVKVFHLSPISHLLTFWQMSQMLQLFCHSS
ncbi:hypothetical protein SASPL_101844 [Salvia splendens]|uniref:Uncharacterized protein n=1 Tax=Salvia splendens TaxID=180675 RepID=A0A8X8YWF9_SALSN|nr:hypothetical protein SASPL_101844 [Salvia splendens]